MNTSIYCMALHACCYAYDIACIRHRPATILQWPHPQWEQEGVCQRTRSILKMNKQTLTITCQGLNLCVQKEERREKRSWSLLPCPVWTGSGKTVGRVKVEVSVAQSCPALGDPMDYRHHGILQARILEWVAFPFSRGSSQPRDRTWVSCIAGGFFTSWAFREAQEELRGRESV